MWPLVDQTTLYTLVYRTFLYNETNLKPPKKAPCNEFSLLGNYTLQFSGDKEHKLTTLTNKQINASLKAVQEIKIRFLGKVLL